MSGGKLVENQAPKQAPAEGSNAAMRITDSSVALTAPLPNCFAIKTSRCWLDGRLQPAVLRICDGKIVGITKEDRNITATSIDGALKSPEVPIFNGANDAFIQKMVVNERKERLTRLETLERVYSEAETKVRNKQEELKSLAAALGTNDSQSLTVAQQNSLTQFGKMTEKLGEVQFALKQAKGELKLAEILAKQEMVLKDKIDKLSEETRQLGRLSIHVELKRSEIAGLEGVLRRVGEEIERTRIELKTASRINLLSSADNPIFDLADAVVTPGLFSGHANLGLDRLIDPQSESDASLVVAADGFARDFNGELKLVRNGFLRALLAPGSSNPISGNASLVRIGATEPTIVRDAAAKFVLSSNARNANRFPSSLAGQIQMVSQSLKGTLLPSRMYLPASIEQKLQDRRMSILKEVASGIRVAIVEAQTDAELLSALQLIETQKLNAFLLGPKQLKNHIDRIQKSKSTLVVQPVTANSFDWYLQDIVQATKAGIPICFAGESAEQLRLTASLAVGLGADHNQMLSALCDVPKALHSPPGRAGLAIDGPADLVIWSGSPLNLEAKPLYVLVDGQFASSKGN